MAAQTCARVQTATLSGTTADSVAFTGSGKMMTVSNHHATERLHFRTDGTTAVRDADEAFCVLPGRELTIGPSKFGAKTAFSVVGNGNIYTVAIF